MYITFIKFENCMTFREKEIIWKTLEVTTKISVGRYKLGAYRPINNTAKEAVGWAFSCNETAALCEMGGHLGACLWVSAQPSYTETTPNFLQPSRSLVWLIFRFILANS